MNLTRCRGVASAAFLAGVALLAVAVPALAQRHVLTKDPEHPLVQYADSLISLNDRCIVRGGTLNPAYKPVYVNGRPIGFC